MNCVDADVHRLVGSLESTRGGKVAAEVSRLIGMPLTGEMEKLSGRAGEEHL